MAIAATHGFETPAEIRGEQFVVNGIRFPFVNAEMPAAVSLTPFGSLRGSVVIIPGLISDIRASLPSSSEQSRSTGFRAELTIAFFRFAQEGSYGQRSSEDHRSSGGAGLHHQSRDTPAFEQRGRSNIAVVDTDGAVLGIFSTPDAPMFGFDVCVQKARTGALFSIASAAAQLRAAEGGEHRPLRRCGGHRRDRLDGSVAFSDRAQGFLSRPFFPDCIDEAEHGPFSVPIENFSPFDVGLQLDLLGVT